MKIENLIELINELKSNVEIAIDGYRQLVLLIDEEHAIARIADLARMEAVTQKKASIVERLRVVVDELKRDGTKVQGMQSPTSGESRSAQSLSETVTHIKQLVAEVDQREQNKLGKDVLHHVFHQLNLAVDQLLELRRTSQPKIEMNKFLLEQLLYHRRENVRFWQDVLHDSDATYNQAGRSRSDGSNSTIVVRT